MDFSQTSNFISVTLVLIIHLTYNFFGCHLFNPDFLLLNSCLKMATEESVEVTEIEPPTPVGKDEEVEASKSQGMNENFFYNTMLARALLQILPHKGK